MTVDGTYTTECRLSYCGFKIKNLILVYNFKHTKRKVMTYSSLPAQTFEPKTLNWYVKVSINGINLYD